MIGCIIQARTGSKRLPGKVMMSIDQNDAVLSFGIKQIKSCKKIDDLVIATTDLPEDDIIVDYMNKLNIKYFRGSSKDVLDRYYQCAKKFSFSIIVRITSDCPLVDPGIVDRVISYFLKNEAKIDYVSNIHPIMTFPDGTNVEVFSFKSLEKVWNKAEKSSEREHVTPYLYTSNEFQLGEFENSQDLSSLRWTVDYKEDLELIRKIVRLIPNRPILMENILDLFSKYPKLKKINRSMLRILVIGAGSIGQRHISNLVKIIPRRSINVYDTEKSKMDFVSKKFKILSLSRLTFDNYDCLLVCTPTSTHAKLAIDGLKHGCHAFIEKPLSSNTKAVASLKKLAKKKNLFVFVGYNFRFNSGLNNIKKILHKKQLGKIISVSAEYGQYLPDWRPFYDYRKCYSASKLLGGGIIHDSSHELDYLIWLFGNPKEIQSNYIKTNILKTDVEAIAEIILKFKNNILGRIHLDFIRREYKRSAEILCENGIISWSLKEGTVKIFNAKNQKWKILQKSESINQMYLSEMRHIINCLKHNKSSKIIHLENGINSQKFSDLIMKSGKNGNKIKI